VDSSWYPPVREIALIEPAHAGQGLTCLTGVVSSVEDRHVRIDLDAGAILPEERDDVVVSFFRPEALYRLKGTAVLHLGPPPAIDLDVHESEQIQRRAAPRLECDLPVELSALDGEGSFSTVLGHTVDVGPGGCHVVTDRAYDISSDPTVTLKMPDGAQVVALARVVGASRDNRGSHHYRLVFAALEANDARVITKLVERGLTKLNS
jgi:PilZ domain